jgi:hypothetical protein
VLFVAKRGVYWDNQVVSNRERVIELVSRLPENTPLEQIAREIELLAGINKAREQARRGEGLPAEEARKLVDSCQSANSPIQEVGDEVTSL